MPNPPGTRVDIVVCQKHGLRFNRITDTGCAMCRREGTSAEPARPASSTGAVRAHPAAPAPAPRPAAPPPTAARPPAPPAPPFGGAPPPRPAVPAAQTPPRAAATPARPAMPTPPPPLAPPSSEALPPLLPDLPPASEALTATGSRPLDVATCERHGLRYNRAVESGCVRCRREGGVTSKTGAGASRPGAAPRAAEPPASVATQLLIAALLVGGTGGVCYAAHQAVLASFAGGLLVQTGSAGMDVVDDPGEAYGSDATTEPAAWPPPRPTAAQPTAPPGMKGRGPVEQQKQIEEFFRMQQEEEAKERGEEPPPDDGIPQ
jgi:hypothetical protein